MKIAILSFDIESTGPNIIKNEIIAIGYCLGDNYGNILYKKRINIKYTQPFDKICYKNFWSKHQDKLKILQNDAVKPDEAISEFIKDVDAAFAEYDLKIISDNPSFDVGFINYYLALYLDRKPINYKFNEIYTPVYDTDSYSRGVVHATYDKDVYDSELIKKYKLEIDQKYDHLPDNDAAYIYLFHTQLMKKAVISLSPTQNQKI